MRNRTLGLMTLLLVSSLASAADNMNTITQKFIGDYELVSYFSYPAQGSEVDMDYIGRLSYDAFGNMSGLGMPNNLPERQAATSERLTSGFAYWGKFSIDAEKGIVTHHVKGSPMVARWVGGDNVRYYEWVGDDILQLTVKNEQGRATGVLTWRRLK